MGIVQKHYKANKQSTVTLGQKMAIETHAERLREKAEEFLWEIRWFKSATDTGEFGKPQKCPGRMHSE